MTDIPNLYMRVLPFPEELMFSLVLVNTSSVGQLEIGQFMKTDHFKIIPNHDHIVM